MKSVILLLVLSLSACVISGEGADIAAQPTAVQGANDVQGTPIYSGAEPRRGTGPASSGPSAGPGVGTGLGF